MKLNRVVVALAAAAAVISLAASAAAAETTGAPGDVGSPTVMLFAQPDGSGTAILPERIVRESDAYRSSQQRVCATYQLESFDLVHAPGDIGGPPELVISRSPIVTRCVWISAKANRAIVPGAVVTGLKGDGYAISVRYTWRLGNGRLIGTRVDESAGGYRCYTKTCDDSASWGAFGFL